MTTEEFIAQNLDADVRRLALEGHRYPEVDMPWALDQIRGRQTARIKLPSWARTPGLVYPPHLALEQCSSEHTALYKARLAARFAPRFAPQFAPQFAPEGSLLLDLTGGFGVDFSFMAPAFARAVYVERQPHLCQIAQKNFRLLGLDNAEIVCADSVDALSQLPEASLIFLDPARRDAHGARTYALADCTPDIQPLLPRLLEKAPTVMVKLSPMLDWHKAVADLGHVTELHILSVHNECKELLLVLCRPADGRPTADGSLRVVCADIGSSTFSYTQHEALAAAPPPSLPLSEARFLHEPNASLMKAGCFNLIATRYGVCKAAPMSNLFLSAEPCQFPGRSFEITAVTSLNKKELRQALGGISQANIAVRNFPLTADQLRRRLKLRDGGPTYIFGTTDSQGRHLLAICRK